MFLVPQCGSMSVFRECTYRVVRSSHLEAASYSTTKGIAHSPHANPMLSLLLTRTENKP